MASDLDIAVRWSKRFETLLARRYNAQGRGLHEKVDSVESDLDRDTVRALRLVATVRNKIVHEDGYTRIDRKREFQRACKLADRAIAGRGRLRKFVIIAGLAMIGLGIVAAIVMGRSLFKIF